MQFTRWGFARITIVTAVASAALAFAFSFAMPEHWVSQAVVTIATPDAAPAGPRMAQIQARALSRNALTSLIHTLGLYPAERGRMPMEDVIDKMNHAIVLKAIPSAAGTTTAFSSEFDYPDRHLAQKVNQELVSRMIDANVQVAAESRDRGNFMRLEIIDPPTLPATPRGPDRATLAAGGLLAGAFGGMLLALAIRIRRKANGICPTCGRPIEVTASH